MTSASPLAALAEPWVGSDRAALALALGLVVAAWLVHSTLRGRTTEVVYSAAGHGLVLSCGFAQALWLVHLQGSTAAADLPAGRVLLCAAALLGTSWLTATGALLAVDVRSRSRAALALVGALASAAQLAAGTGLLVLGPARPWVVVALVALVLLVLVARRTRHQVPVSEGDHDEVDPRSGTATAVAVLLTTVTTVLLTAGPGGRYLDVVSGTFLCLVVACGGVRALALRRQRTGLLDDLARQVRTDDLTGLPNRLALVELLQREHRSGRRGAVVVKIGLDSFYELNASFGAALGDAALQALARALLRAVPEGWTVHRTGGDQFVLRGPGGAEEGREVAAAALATVSGLGIAGDEQLSACAGVAEETAHDDPTAVLSDAAAALRQAKADGDGATAVHDAELVARSRRQHALVAGLREALARDALSVHLQPVVDVVSGATAGFELLSRWEDRALGVVPPDEFVPLAEASGLVHLLGASVLRQGLDAFVAAGGVERRLRVSVNASVHELRRPAYTGDLRRCAAERGVPLDLLTVEVTESLFLARDDPAARTLVELRDAGVQLAIDDFGTGYSSLGYLERLPVTVVKIDRSLVVAASASDRSRSLLAAVVAVCRALDLGLVAEGVEDAVQARVVADLGITHGQGWYWSRSLAPHEVAAHLAAPPRQLDRAA